MSDEKQQLAKKRIYLMIAMITVVSSFIFLAVEFYSVQLSVVPADCFLVQSTAFEIPENVVTKGYDIIRDVNGTVIGNDCYYLKNAGMFERMFYGWQIYQ